MGVLPSGFSITVMGGGASSLVFGFAGLAQAENENKSTNNAPRIRNYDTLLYVAPTEPRSNMRMCRECDILRA